MSSSMDIQIVSEPNLQKIESFLNDSTYRETIEVSANFNTRLCIERRLRLPFLETQTGVAQNHCSLYMSRKQRMPGFRTGQVYTYPSLRWRKSRRQYLSKMVHPFSSVMQANPVPPCPTSFQGNGLFGSSTAAPPTTLTSFLTSNAGIGGLGSTSGGFLVTNHDDSNSNNSLEKLEMEFDAESNSRDTNNNSKIEELSRDWLYDDLDNDFDNISEPKSPDDEYDYDPRYGNKKRAKKATKKELKSSKKSSGNSDSVPSQGSASSTSSKSRKRDSSAKSSENRSRPGRKKGSTLANKNNVPVFEEPPSFDSMATSMDPRYF